MRPGPRRSLVPSRVFSVPHLDLYSNPLLVPDPGPWRLRFQRPRETETKDATADSHPRASQVVFQRSTDGPPREHINLLVVGSAIQRSFTRPSKFLIPEVTHQEQTLNRDKGPGGAKTSKVARFHSSPVTKYLGKIRKLSHPHTSS